MFQAPRPTLPEFCDFIKQFHFNESSDIVVSASDDQIIATIQDKKSQDDDTNDNNEIRKSETIQLLNNFAFVKSVEGFDVKKKFL